MKKNPEYLLLVEHVARELDIACLIKYLIEQNGSVVEIMSLPYFNGSTIKKNHLKVLAIPYCNFLGPTYRSILPHFSNISVLNLAYEQLFANVTENMKSPKDEFAKKLVTHHAWSLNYSDFLKKYGVNSTNIHINGNLSFALYNYPYRNFFITRAELARKYNLNPLKKWLFIPENYAAAFYSNSAIHEKISMGMDPLEITQYRNFAEQSLKEVIKWCEKSSKTNDIEIIFRPRPATSREKMSEFFNNTIPSIPENLHIITNQTVREWILASDLVMSSYSTTLIEAAIAEKPIAMLSPFPIPDFLHVPWYDMVPKLENYNEFIQMISIPSSNSYKSLKRWAETEMMSNGDPIRGLVNLMLSVNESGIRIPKNYIKKSDESSKISIQNLARQCYNHITPLKNRIFVRRPTIVENYKNDFFTPLDVISCVARWEKVLGDKKQ